MKIGGGDDDSDPMSNIIAAIRAGKASDLKKSSLPTTNQPKKKVLEAETSGGTTTPILHFQLRKTEKKIGEEVPATPSPSDNLFKVQLRKTNSQMVVNESPSTSLESGATLE